MKYLFTRDAQFESDKEQMFDLTHLYTIVYLCVTNFMQSFLFQFVQDGLLQEFITINIVYYSRCLNNHS